nr:LAGLIDADG family homing endonuclease [Rhizobium album]
MLAGGTPCFTAGHMVLSAKGYVPIEEIRVGDEVVTHKGRLRTVVRIGNERKEVGVLTGVGMCEPITCTADHPFLSVEWRNQNTRRDNLYTKVEHCGHPEWVAAKDMPGRQWCQLLSHDNDNRAPESAKFDVKTAMYIAGMYLGDGWIRRHDGKAKKSVVLGINPGKYVKLKAAIGNAVHTVSHERTTVRVSIHDTAFADWLEAEFAHYSHMKTVPSWVMGHSFRGEFLRGFLDTDGSVTNDGKVSISTTSRPVAYGISDLMAAEGYVSSVALVETPDTCVIEGRTCNQRDYYQVRAYPQPMSRKSRVRHGMMLRTVSGFTPVGEETVFNIEVDEDHSYVVQSAVVHNCQAFSVAGLRQSLADARGNLSLEFVRLAHELADRNGLRNAVWENVVGVLSTKDNAFGCFLAGLVGADAPIDPPARGKWPRHGMVSGPKGRAAWAVKDAQFFGVAQRRRRVLVVADFGNGADPAAVLFEPESVCRHPPTRGEAGKDVAGFATGGLGSCGELTPSASIAPCLRARSNASHRLDTEAVVAYAPEIARCDATREGSSQDYETTTMVAVQTLDGSDVARTLSARHDGSPCVDRGPDAVVCFTAKDYGGDAQFDLSPTLRAGGFTGSHANAGVMPAICEVRPINTQVGLRHQSLGERTGLGIGDDGDPSFTLSKSHSHAVQVSSAVRRLTPMECERLQGFEDNYTRIPIKHYATQKITKNRPADMWEKDLNGGWWLMAADGPRYKSLGNSWAVPKFQWLGMRIQASMPANDNLNASPRLAA